MMEALVIPLELVLNWTATDACGNVAILAQSIVIIRPDAADVVQAADVVLSCGEDETTALNDFAKTGTPGIKVGKIVNGVLIPSDTIALNETDYVCGYILQHRDVSIPADCGIKVFRYWDILDWCDADKGPLPLDTQFIALKDTLAPTFVENQLATTSIELPHYSCEADITKISQPLATDNCSEVSVRLAAVSRIENGELWAVPTTDWATLNCDSFQLSWIAQDACL